MTADSSNGSGKSQETVARSWVDKYAPRSVDDVVGQGSSVKQFLEWYEEWSPGSNPALLHGGPGTGKTSLVHALAEERDLDLIEINASDTRNKDAIEELLGGATQQMSLFRKGKIILVDEVDGLSGRSDRGGVGAMIRVAKESKFPMVMTANDPYATKLRSLRSKTEMISFGKVHLNSMTARLNQICEEEGVDCDRSVLKQLGRTAGGDMRAALNDLEALAKGRDSLTKDDLQILGYREQEQNVFEALKIIFKTSDVGTAVRALRDIDKDPDEILWWLIQNVPKEYEDPHEVADAFDSLSRADLFRGRIRVNQNWRFKKYMIDTMCGGVALAKEESYRKFTKYAPPQRFTQYARTRGKRNKMKKVCEKLAPRLHVSPNVIMSQYIQLFRILLSENEPTTEEVMQRFEQPVGKEKTFEERLVSWGLEEDEIDILRA